MRELDKNSDHIHRQSRQRLADTDRWGASPAVSAFTSVCVKVRGGKLISIKDEANSTECF